MCTSVLDKWWVTLCSQNRHTRTNTMSRGEWQRPVLAPCAMWPSSLRRPSWPRKEAPPEPAQYHKCHPCHAKWRSMSPSCPRLTRKVEVDVASATPAAQSEGLCRQVPRLQRKVHVHLQDSPSVSKCHACQAECRSMSPSARKQPRRQRLQLGTKRAARASPVP